MQKIIVFSVLFASVLVTGFGQQPISQPRVSHPYIADPSAHVFKGKLYIYPSHDIKSNKTEDNEGGHFDMKDYHIFSMDDIGSNVTDHGIAKNIPWANRHLCIPDAGKSVLAQS